MVRPRIPSLKSCKGRVFGSGLARSVCVCRSEIGFFSVFVNNERWSQHECKIAACIQQFAGGERQFFSSSIERIERDSIERDSENCRNLGKHFKKQNFDVEECIRRLRSDCGDFIDGGPRVREI